MYAAVFILILFVSFYITVTISYLVCSINCFNLDFLNPIRNHKKYTSFNWFGVIVCTLILNIIWLPYAIIYWIYKFIYFIFTMKG